MKHGRLFALALVFVGAACSSVRGLAQDSLTLDGGVKEGVSVVRKMPRTVQHGDTTTFFAKAYKVNADATAYDLISKKLPGISVRDGKLEAYGETVTEVLLDGRDFFKDDVLLALKNLPASVIAKIQLFDQSSDYGRLAELNDGHTHKAINIVTSEGEKKRRIFGRAYAGGGVEDVYHAYGMLNIFDPKQRISLFAQGNNVGERDFSVVDMVGSTGSMTSQAPNMSPFARGSHESGFHPESDEGTDNMVAGESECGDNESYAAGVNYSAQSNDAHLKISGHYVFDHQENRTLYDVADDYFSDSGYTLLQHQDVCQDNWGHRANMKIEWSLSPSDQMVLRPSLLFQRKKESSALNFQTTNQHSATLQDGFSTSNEWVYIHSFKRPGHSVSANIRFSYSSTDEEQNFDAHEEAFLTKKEFTAANTASALSVMLSYVHPYNRYVRARLSLGWSGNRRQAERLLHNDSSPDSEQRENAPLSGQVTSVFRGVLGNVALHYERRRLTASAGTEVCDFRNTNRAEAVTVRHRSSPLILPYAVFKWRGINDAQLYFRYHASQTYPTALQLHEVVNTSSPTLYTCGNSALRSMVNHSLSLRYVMPNLQHTSIFVFFVNTDFIRHYIASSVSLPEGTALITGPQTSSASGGSELVQAVGNVRVPMLTYNNVHGFRSWKALLAYGFPFPLISSNVNASTFFRHVHIPGFLNGARSDYSQLVWSNSLTVGSNLNENVDFVVDANSQYIYSRNASFQTLDVKYWSLSLGAQLNWLLMPRVKVVLEGGHTAYHGLDSHRYDATICHAALAYKVFKRKNGELKVSVKDLFNQNNYFVRVTNEYFRREATANVLGRYMMVTFTHTINQ